MSVRRKEGFHNRGSSGTSLDLALPIGASDLTSEDARAAANVDVPIYVQGVDQEEFNSIILELSCPEIG